MLDFTIFGFIALASLISTFISSRLKAPAVIFLIILGMLFGPHCLGFIKENDTIKLFSEIGSVLLLFLIGMEFNFEKLKEAGLIKVSVIFLIEITFIFALMYSTFSLLGFEKEKSIYLSSIFAFTSTALVSRILKEMGLYKRKEVPVIIGVCVLEDISLVFFLSFVSSLAIRQEISLTTIALSLLESFLVLLFVIFLLLKFSKFVSTYFPKDNETRLMVAIGLLSFFLWLSNSLGMSSSLGAFVAGSIIFSFSTSKIRELIDEISILFVSVFFLSFGMYINPYSILFNLPIIFLLSVLVIIGKIISISSGFRIFGYPIESSFFASTSMTSLGEASILLASYGTSIGIISTDLFSIIPAVVMVTSSASFFLIKFHKEIGRFFERFFVFKKI